MQGGAGATLVDWWCFVSVFAGFGLVCLNNPCAGVLPALIGVFWQLAVALLLLDSCNRLVQKIATARGLCVGGWAWQAAAPGGTQEGGTPSPAVDRCF
jgi:apolipoprotein N-acyltransferase